jgi:hypothetical protein
MTKHHFDNPHHADAPSKSPSEFYSAWPIGSRELVTLLDLGMSDDQIAKYFRVEQQRVSALRAYYGI